MPALLVIPEDTFVVMREASLNLAGLCDINYMSKHLSASDLADIHIALHEFPFVFSSELGFEKAKSPLDQLAQIMNEESKDSIKLQDLYNRVNGRIDSYMLNKSLNADNSVYQYSLQVINENLWVAVQQRLRDKPSDPSRLLLRANASFFDDMMAQALHSIPFNRVCSTNLFTYYLGSL